MNPLPVVLIGTQAYNWLLEPFSALFAKYWGEHILYIGDTPPAELPANVTFMQVPAYSEGVWPWNHWFGNGLISICHYFAGDVIALFLLDQWLNKPVDLKAVMTLARYMRKAGENIVRVNLTEQDGWENADIVTIYDNLDILQFNFDSPYHSFDSGLTFCPSLWHTNTLAKLIKPHWTLQECELLGTREMRKHRELISIGSRPAALSRTHGLFSTYPKRVSLDGLAADDRQMIIDHIPAGYYVTD